MSSEFMPRGLESLSLLLASAPADGDATSGGLTFINVALLIFVIVFVGIVLWALAGGRDRFRPHAEIPLHDEPVTPIDGKSPTTGADR